MRASDLRIEASPHQAGTVRASVAISYLSGRPKKERWWFEVPAAFAPQVSHSADPWLTAMLPLAWTLGEPLETELPADPQLVQGLVQVQDLWCRWFPWFEPIPVQAERTAESEAPRDQKTSSFVSGGVDSTYNVLHYDRNHHPPLDELIFIRGFDLQLENMDALRIAEERVEQVARGLGKDLILVASNLRSTRLQEANWERLVHAPFLAATGLLLSARYRLLLAGSARPSTPDVPLGSHPVVFPHFSTSTTQVKIYAPQLEKGEKISYLSQFPHILDHLRVCWESMSGANCGRCTKCLYTMAGLEIYDVLAGCSAFPQDQLNLRHLRSLYMGKKGDYFKDLRARAVARGRDDIAEAIEAAFLLTERLDRWLLFDRWLGLIKRWRIDPHIRRLTEPVRPLLWRLLRTLSRLLILLPYRS